MRQNDLAARLLRTFFDDSLDIRIQTYNLLMIIGIAAGLVMAGVASIRGENAKAVIIINVALSVFAAIMLIIAEKKKAYYICSWFIVISTFMITFPLLFFYGGGYRGGMPNFFVVGIVYTTYLMESPARPVALALEMIIYVSCFLLNLFVPSTIINYLHEAYYGLDILMSFIVSGVMLILISHLRALIIQSKQTQIQELNRELIARNETLAQYDSMKSDFLATVAHELNTPLAVIAASSADTMDLLQETPLNLREISENQILIDRRVKLIDGILLDLMDTVAIENGRVSLNRQPVDLHLLIKNTCDTQIKKTDVRDNSFAYDLQEGLGYIWADPARIEQVIMNLLSNAIQHTDKGKITISLSGGAGMQTVRVSDNGEGMDEQTAQAVLRKYVSSKTDYWRHGIGLYICRQIIAAHGGDIRIDSVKGRGTTITFTLREVSSDV